MKTKKLQFMIRDIKSRYSAPRDFNGGGSGLISNAKEYYRFLQMLLNGGELEGERILSRKTIELMTLNHLPDNQTMADMGSSGSFSEVRYHGMGYGLSMAVTTDPAASQSPLSKGSYNWGGMASTYFLVDPKEDLLAIFMTQFIQLMLFLFDLRWPQWYMVPLLINQNHRQIEILQFSVSNFIFSLQICISIKTILVISLRSEIPSRPALKLTRDKPLG